MPILAASPREDDARRQLQDAERRSIEQRAAQQDAAGRAARAIAETVRLAHARAEAASALRLAEIKTQSVASRIDALAQRRRDAERRLTARGDAMQPLLPLIERLSLYPAETLLAIPGPADATLRGVLVLQGLAKQLEIEAEALRQDQSDLDAATEALRQEAPKLTEAEAAQKKQADALDQEIATAHEVRAAAEAEARQSATEAATMAARTDNLRTALAVLEIQRHAGELKALEDAARAERQKRGDEMRSARARAAELAHPAGAGAFAASMGPHGQLQPPVIGVVVKGWGETTDGGPANGVSYHAPPGARVISPCGGRVVFAETFRSYGLLLIVDCGGGYHVVLSGFDRLDVKLGQTIVIGEPVGVMPSWDPGTTARRPELYIELRHDGQPVNPAPWLRSSS